jgi:predicted dehydrogenase
MALPPKNAVDWVSAHVACHQNFICAIETGDAPKPSLAQGAALQDVMEACALADRERRWVSVG